MQKITKNWSQWRCFFENRKNRRLPPLDDPANYSRVPDSVARSLAIFQLGESGGGTVVEQVRSSSIKAIDNDYAEAVRLFVDEEHRHAEILAICVRNLGGNLIHSNWTAKLFVFARRLIGIRLKVVVLLAAEVVGLCYYHLLSSRLPRSRVQSLLAQLVDDERAHLNFHCDFLRTQTPQAWQKKIFKLVWKIVTKSALWVVLYDHRDALKDLDVTAKSVCTRWTAISDLAETMVLNGADDCQPLLSALQAQEIADRNAYARTLDDPGKVVAPTFDYPVTRTCN